MKKIPDIVFVVDGVYERQALREANALKLSTFAILNTNGDDTVVDNCIPANTNSVKSVEFLLNELNASIVKTALTAPAKVRKTTEKSAEKKVAVKRAPRAKKADKVETSENTEA